MNLYTPLFSNIESTDIYNNIDFFNQVLNLIESKQIISLSNNKLNAVFDEAFCFSEASPDVLAVAAIIDNEIVGMAGASADSPSFWQIGINVNKNFEGRHIASGLVSILKSDILKKGIVPYYGTSFSNLASQHVAARAGFEVAWVELITEKNTADDVYTG